MDTITLSGLQDFARSILGKLPQKAQGATVVALQGDLGAGKTTFVQALARELGIHETIQSPTYVLMKKYDISYRNFSALIHIDAYRLNNPAEFGALKPEDFLHDPRALICIEWPQNVGGALPVPDLTLKFSLNGAKEGERYIEIT